MVVRDQVTLLRDEHRGIVRQLDLVGRSLEAPLVGQRKGLRGSISELGIRLEAHFAHEERAIYAPLDSKMKGDSPTRELVKDHRLIRGTFRTLDVLAAQGASAAELRNQVSSLRTKLGRHLKKEEKVVYWLADCQL